MTTLAERVEVADGMQGDTPSPTFSENMDAVAGQYQSALSEIERLRRFLSTLFVNIHHAPDKVSIEFVGFFCKAALNGCTESRAFHKWHEKEAAARRKIIADSG